MAQYTLHESVNPTSSSLRPRVRWIVGIGFKRFCPLDGIGDSRKRKLAWLDGRLHETAQSIPKGFFQIITP